MHRSTVMPMGTVLSLKPVFSGAKALVAVAESGRAADVAECPYIISGVRPLMRRAIILGCRIYGEMGLKVVSVVLMTALVIHRMPRGQHIIVLRQLVLPAVLPI